MILEIILAVAAVSWLTRREPSALEQEAQLRLAEAQAAREWEKTAAIQAKLQIQALKNKGWMQLHAERHERSNEEIASQERFERNLRAAQREVRRQKWAAEGYTFQP